MTTALNQWRNDVRDFTAERGDLAGLASLAAPPAQAEATTSPEVTAWLLGGGADNRAARRHVEHELVGDAVDASTSELGSWIRAALEPARGLAFYASTVTPDGERSHFVGADDRWAVILSTGGEEKARVAVVPAEAVAHHLLVLLHPPLNWVHEDGAEIPVRVGDDEGASHRIRIVSADAPILEYVCDPDAGLAVVVPDDRGVVASIVPCSRAELFGALVELQHQALAR